MGKKIELQARCYCGTDNLVRCEKPGLVSSKTVVMNCSDCGSKSILKIIKTKGTKTNQVQVHTLKLYASEVLREAIKAAAEEEKAKVIEENTALLENLAST